MIQNNNPRTSFWQGIEFVAIRSVQRGVSKGVEDGHRPLALLAGHTRKGRKAVSGMAHPQGVEGLGMAGPGETLRSLWIPLAIRA
jgi:hypothetical protein